MINTMLPDATQADASALLPIGWLCDALDRDRSHVMVLCATPLACSADVSARLLRHPLESLEVVKQCLAGLEPDAALAKILGVREGLSLAEMEVRLQQKIEELLVGDTALVLALPDATSITTATLGWLGDLASVSKQGLRLALFVDCSENTVDAVAAKLVGRLGVGVEKLVVGLPAGQGAEPPGPSASERFVDVCSRDKRGPPRIESERAKCWSRGRVIRVRRHDRQRRGYLAGGLGLCVVAALQVAWWSSSSVDHANVLGAHDRASERKIPSARLDLVGPDERVSEIHNPPMETPSDEPDAATVRATVRLDSVPTLPDLAPDLAPDGIDVTDVMSPIDAVDAVKALAPPQVVRVQTIPVNLNADPWAHLELDGRPVGTTPLANLPVEPGTHRVVVRLPDGVVIEQTIEVSSLSRYFRFP